MSCITKISVDSAHTPKERETVGETSLEIHRRREYERSEREKAYLSGLRSGSAGDNLSRAVLDRQLEIDDIADEMGL